MARAFARGGHAKNRKTTGLWSLNASFAVAAQQAGLGAWESCTFMIFSYMWAWALLLKTRVLWGGRQGNHGPISAAVPSPPAPAAQAMA